MDETLFSDLLAIVRASADDAGRSLAARLGEPGAPTEAELSELARRAREQRSTDDEVALALGALLATARMRAP
jgi:hypothetical protein